MLLGLKLRVRLQFAAASHFRPESGFEYRYVSEVLIGSLLAVPYAHGAQVEELRRYYVSRRWLQRRELWNGKQLLAGLELWARISSRIYLHDC